MDRPDRGSASGRDREAARKLKIADDFSEEEAYDEQDEYDEEEETASRQKTTETVNRATSARMADRAAAKRPAPSAKPSVPRRLDKKEAGMIDFKEELLKYKPLLDVDDIEDSIRLDEMTDVMDLLQQLLKSMKTAPAADEEE